MGGVWFLWKQNWAKLLVSLIKYEQGQLVKNLLISKWDIKVIRDNNIFYNEIKDLIKF